MDRIGQQVFFPWERRPLWLLGRRGLHVRLLVLAVAVLVLLVWLRGREEQKAAVRATRAAITSAHNATVSFRADHGGQCPRGAADLVAGGYVRDVPIDAWGKPLRIECAAAAGDGVTGRVEEQTRGDARAWRVVDVSITSDGPDGLPQGLDRVR